jgi:beta-phosphoglucomutase-like phosphatase (HAD superfamily)
MSAGTSERRLPGVVFDLDGTLVDSMSAFPIVDSSGFAMISVRAHDSFTWRAEPRP